MKKKVTDRCVNLFSLAWPVTSLGPGRRVVLWVAGCRKRCPGCISPEMQDPANGRLFNIWVNEHDLGHFAGAAPVLIMDVFEHAFMIDYGLRKADYIEAFFKAVDWAAAEARLA